jgi:hypothetical protein
LFSFLTSVLYPNLSSTSLAKLQYEWFDKSEGNFKSLLVNTLKDLKRYEGIDSDIDFDAIPSFISLNSVDIKKKFADFLTTITTVRNTLAAKLKFNDQRLVHENIARFERFRCSNYAENKAAFIASSLNRTKRSIVLDRALIKLPNGEVTLTINPLKIKQAAVKHFKLIAGLPPVSPSSISDLPSS